MKEKTWRERAMSLTQNRTARLFGTSGAVLLSALLQSFAIQALVRPAGIISGGFTGFAMLAERAGELVGVSISMQAVMLILNIPVALFCARGISLRFTIFSLLHVMLSSFFLQVCHFAPLFDDQVLNVIFGGVLLGISVVIALKGNASTGGTDFIALYVSNRTGKSIWTWVFMGNAVMYCVYGALFGWMAAGYSIVIQYISTRMISSFHHRYDLVTMQITTAMPEEVTAAYVREYRHGITITPGTGGFSHQPFALMHTVVSSYEVKDIVDLMRAVDPHLIVNVYKTEDFFGGFYRKPLD